MASVVELDTLGRPVARREHASTRMIITRNACRVNVVGDIVKRRT